MERAFRVAYAFIIEDGIIHSPAIFIHSAIFSVAPRSTTVSLRLPRGRRCCSLTPWPRETSW